MKQYIKLTAIYAAVAVICILITKSFFPFLFIILHEAAHIAAGLILGLKLNSVRLLPVGINADFKEEFIQPGDEILISISGPFLNLIFFIAFYAANYQGFKGFEELYKINLVLFLFNMFPASFLDGGRILKCIIKTYFNFYKAGIISSLNGIIFGCIIMIMAFVLKLTFTSIFIIMLSIFILAESIKEKRELTINIIKDAINKKNYIIARNKFKAQVYVIDKNERIIDLIKMLCFNRYTFFCHISDGISNIQNEEDIIKSFLSYGNITFEDSFNKNTGRNIDG